MIFIGIHRNLVQYSQIVLDGINVQLLPSPCRHPLAVERESKELNDLQEQLARHMGKKPKKS